MRYIILSIWIVLLASCSRRTEYSNKFDSKLCDSLLAKLNQSFYDSSEIKLNIFLENWANRYKGKSKSEISYTERDAYEIFQKFYTPFNISRIGGCEWDELNKGIKYVIVQNKLDLESKIITDFRPELNLGDSIRILYLTAEYDSAINRFLKNKFYSLGTGNIMNPAYPKDDSYFRYKFLYKYLNIYPGHWGGYWQLLTPPSIHYIEYGFLRLNAKTHFVLVYEGGIAKFRYGFKGWKMIESKRTWIE